MHSVKNMKVEKKSIKEAVPSIENVIYMSEWPKEIEKQFSEQHYALSMNSIKY